MNGYELLMRLIVMGNAIGMGTLAATLTIITLATKHEKRPFLVTTTVFWFITVGLFILAQCSPFGFR